MLKRARNVPIFFIVGFLIGMAPFHKLPSVTKTELNVQRVDNSVSNPRKIRILCFIGTTVKYFGKRAIHVKETWGKHCDKLIFVSNTTNDRLGSVGLNVTDDYLHLWFTHFFMVLHI